MCNDYRARVGLAAIERGFSDLRIPLLFPEGRPNLEPRDDIWITDPGAIVRASREKAGAAELVQRRWSWPGARGKPVYNFRSEGRTFSASGTGGRCLIVADGFYEFTDQPGGSGRARKSKWLFTVDPDGPLAAQCDDSGWFCIAGLWRSDAAAGEAFTMLTVAPGPDVAPYHDRQIAILAACNWAEWLDPAVPSGNLLAPSPAGSLRVTEVVR